MKSPGDTDVISIQKAADILGVTTKTLRRWEAKGVLVPTRTAGNQRRYLVSDIHAFQNKKGAADSSLSPFHTVGLQDSAFRFSSSLSFMQKSVIGLFSLLLLISGSAVLGSRIGSAVKKEHTSVLGITESPQRLFDGIPEGAVLAASDDSREYVMKINIPAQLYSGMTVEGDSIIKGNVDIEGVVTAENLSDFLSGLTAGGGISVTSGATPTIANMGVLSVGGKTGAVTLTAGSGITIDGTTISASSTTSTSTTTSVNAFQTIDVDGTAITAGSKDTLYFVSGTGITLSTSGKYITVTNNMNSPLTVSEGGTGLASYTAGDMLYASAGTTLAKIGIGTAGQVLTITGGVPAWGTISGDACTNCLVADPSSAQVVTPTADIVGFSVRGASGGTSDIFTIKDYAGTSTYFQTTSAGNLVLGNSTSNTVAFTSRVASNIIPSTGSQYDLGSSDRRWKTVYGDDANFTNFSSSTTTIAGTTSEDFLINTDYAADDGQSSTLSFERGSPAVNAQLKWNASDVSGINRLFSFNAGLYINPDTGIYSSGKASFIVNQPFSEDILTASASGVGKFVIKNSGAVGIGTTNPTGMLQVTGDEVRIGDGGTADYASADGDLYVEDALEVDGTAYVGGLYIAGTQVTATASELNLIDGTTVTSGGVMFGDGTKITQDAANFFWDDTNNRVGIGTTGPSAGLHVLGTTEQLRLGYDSSNYMSFTVGSDGTLTLSDTGNTIVAFSDAQANFSVPAQFSAAGDVDMAYDLIFSNQTSSNINSWGPLQITSGESFENNNLTLKTYGTGDLFADIGGNFIMQSADPAMVFDTLTATDTDFWMGITEDAGGDDDDVFQIGKGTTIGTTPYLTMDYYGRVGIGTTVPTSRLQVSNSGQTVLGKALVAFDQYENQPILVASASGAAKFMVDYTGNVGIGNTAPAGLLQVGSSATASFVVTSAGHNAADTGSLRVEGTILDINSLDFIGAGGMSSGGSSDLTLTAGGGDVFFSNTTTLNIGGNGTDVAYNIIGDTNAGASSRMNSDDDFLIEGDFDVLGTTYMNGNVGIGTTAPTDKLDVSGGVKVGSGYAGIGTTAPANGMIIQGNVGIGTTQPGYTFQVQVDASNQGHVNPDGSWSNGSDARIKTNVLTLTKGLGTVMGLRPVTYNSISDPTGERMGLLVGFIAQEVEESFPEAVDTDPVTGYKSISYTKFIPLLTSAIQEQEQKLALQEFTLSKVEGALRSWISESDSQQKTPPAESSLDSNSDELQPNLSSPYSIATSTPEFNIVSLASSTLYLWRLSPVLCQVRPFPGTSRYPASQDFFQVMTCQERLLPGLLTLSSTATRSSENPSSLPSPCSSKVRYISLAVFSSTAM
ncbi:MAG: Cell wall surface anchor family protein [Candidatus Gottesmanbacteria bacterium GW2011_GWB1_44_11c]|uniref:Cell wall surface anchor family protein n=1 Tax=Candidatus Gottesmanbacteria bacterium GW2011_GWB1_44_11c TaxID=1618447 RepID=A0A0G1GTC3_9BACT|nr:MAG: Cell wall surface anchor family protein [Candidatus Gottesmanbacteria bacterium GW2011_GWB1_44_11c]